MDSTILNSSLYVFLAIVITIQAVHLTSEAAKVSHRDVVSNVKSHSLLRPKEYSHSRSQQDDPTPSSSPCPGHGSCMSSKACEREGGIRKMGLCSHSTEICCKLGVVTKPKCGSWSNDWVSTFTTPKYPAFFNGSTECIFILEPLPGVCAIKIDFKDVVMKGSTKYSTTQKCISDMFFIMNIYNPPVEPLCDLRNYSGIVFLNESAASHNPIKFVFIIQSLIWRTKLRVTQINCGEISPWKNDPHCGRQLMYDAPLEENQLNLRLNKPSDKSKEKVLIVNGQTAEGREFPWQVSIEGTEDTHRCGASVIGSNLILSATHCFAGFNELDKLRIRLGTLNSTRDGEIFEIESIIQHFEYKTFKSHVNDIAIIKLKRNITFSPIVQPICLPVDAAKFENEDGVVSGWGLLSGAINRTDMSPLHLQKLNVRFLSNGECSEWMNHGYSMVLGRDIKVSPVSPTQICAVADKNSTVCFGDSGGPLSHVNTTDGTYTQVGIVSYGVGRCIIKEVIPVVYTRVSEYLKFIAIAAQ